MLTQVIPNLKCHKLNTYNKMNLFICIIHGGRLICYVNLISVRKVKGRHSCRVTINLQIFDPLIYYKSFDISINKVRKLKGVFSHLEKINKST